MGENLLEVAQQIAECSLTLWSKIQTHNHYSVASYSVPVMRAGRFLLCRECYYYNFILSYFIFRYVSTCLCECMQSQKRILTLNSPVFVRPIGTGVTGMFDTQWRYQDLYSALHDRTARSFNHQAISLFFVLFFELRSHTSQAGLVSPVQQRMTLNF